MSIGPWQIVLIVLVVLIFFGPKRIPGLGKSIGSAIRGFKKGLNEDEENRDVTPDSPTEKISNSEKNSVHTENKKETEKS